MCTNILQDDSGTRKGIRVEEPGKEKRCPHAIVAAAAKVEIPITCHEIPVVFQGAPTKTHHRGIKPTSPVLAGLPLTHSFPADTPGSAREY
jgi:hypothetical protein